MPNSYERQAACKYGHDLTDPANVKEYIGVDGFERRYCVLCNERRQQELRIRKKRGSNEDHWRGDVHQTERVRDYIAALEKNDVFTISGTWTILSNEKWLSPTTISQEVRLAVADGRVERIGKMPGKGNTILYRKV